MNEDSKKSDSLDRVWAICLKDLSISAQNVLRRADRPSDLLVRDQPRVSINEYFRFWNALEEDADDQDDQTQFAGSVSSAHLRPATTSPTPNSPTPRFPSSSATKNPAPSSAPFATGPD